MIEPGAYFNRGKLFARNGARRLTAGPLGSENPTPFTRRLLDARSITSPA